MAAVTLCIGFLSNLVITTAAETTWEGGYVAANGTFTYDGKNYKSVKDVALNVGDLNIDMPRNIFFDFK